MKSHNFPFLFLSLFVFQFLAFAQSEEINMSTATIENKSVITFKGNAMTLVGKQVSVGQKAPDFNLTGNDLSAVSLKSSAGKVRIVSVIPSIDTPVCDLQTKRFNDEAGKLGAKVAVLTVSMDLPFAQKRWCGAAGATSVQLLSDYKDHSFGIAYGARIKELGLLTRAVFVIDSNDTLQHVEYVSEVTSHPNYDAALAVAKKLI
jgi:thioredoxin-dependent peroxiredoxin